jgi:hypothetical protein
VLSENAANRLGWAVMLDYLLEFAPQIRDIISS